jgi:hypothetical protein
MKYGPSILSQGEKTPTLEIVVAVETLILSARSQSLGKEWVGCHFM